MNAIASVDQALSDFRASIGGRPGYDQIFVHLKSSRSLAFDLASAQGNEGPKPLTVFRMNLRVVHEGKECWVNREITDIGAMTQLFDEALRGLEGASPKGAKVVPFNFSGDASLGLMVDETYAIIPIEEKQNRLVNLRDTAMKGLPPSTDLNARYSEGHYREILWQNQAEHPLVNEWTEGLVGITVRTEIDGRKSFFSEQVSENSYFDLDWTHLAKHSVQTLSALFTDRKIELGGVRFVAHPNVAAEFLLLFSALVNGDNFASKQSVLRDKLGKKIMPSIVNIFDDPHYRKKPRSRFWDAEGQATHRVWHVAKGEFKSPSVPSTGIPGFDLPPTAQMRFGEGQVAFALSFHNLIIEPGTKDYVDLIRDLDTGALLTRFDGLDHFDPRTGEFAARVSGLRLDKGQLADAFAEVELAGNLLELFGGVQSIGRDLAWFGGVAAPSILCENKTTGG